VEAEDVGFIVAVKHIFDRGSNEIGKFFKKGLHLLLSECSHFECKYSSTTTPSILKNKSATKAMRARAKQPKEQSQLLAHTRADGSATKVRERVQGDGGIGRWTGDGRRGQLAAIHSIPKL
jgi:hypothetical protein